MALGARPRHLQRLQLNSALPGARVVYSRVRQIGAGGQLAEEIGEPWAQAKPAFRSHVCLPHPGLMHHRSLFEAHLYYAVPRYMDRPECEAFIRGMLPKAA